ncbi:MAG: hypothetical protein KKA71_07465, partial [Proteobacteria bacterium]|nr:hypothetical protein [Pseudomonadota bacterium]
TKKCGRISGPQPLIHSKQGWQDFFTSNKGDSPADRGSGGACRFFSGAMARKNTSDQSAAGCISEGVFMFYPLLF